MSLYTKWNVEKVIEYHKEYPRRGPVRIGLDTRVYRDLNRAAIQRILDILKANKGISVEEVYDKLISR